ncbi:NUDIX domain-containing protein [Streptomyces albus subsp. chlorinus]|uniref:NUDIX domain-containing protein n=1 Tax=Streptomyces albus TaxID=1888 RepID=UPI00156F76B7|nr:NUDIX domain-containing protein [Streptomyces albus]NSC24037.1 NUDIX domain-containing protein [Streptomyces albus subsp. chlorinus]
MKQLVARVWHSLRGPLQWRLLWLAHAKFVVGVTGVVRDRDGRVLLLRHRLWSPDSAWGLPTGFAVRGEDFARTVVREVREETGLTVEPGALVRLRSGYRLRLEVAYEALCTGGTLKLDTMEIREARWFSPDDLPDGLQESHRELIRPPAAS